MHVDTLCSPFHAHMQTQSLYNLSTEMHVAPHRPHASVSRCGAQRHHRGAARTDSLVGTRGWLPPVVVVVVVVVVLAMVLAVVVVVVMTVVLVVVVVVVEMPSVAVGLDPPAVAAADHALVLVLAPAGGHAVVVLEEVDGLVDQRRVAPARQHEPLPAPVVPATQTRSHFVIPSHT